MTRRSGRRSMRRTALASIAWRHPWLVLLGPWVARGVGLLVAYGGLAWLWDSIPHGLLAALTAAAAVAVAVAAVLYRRASAPQKGSRLPVLGRPVLAWALASLGVLLLAGAAYTAIRGTP
jgi:hypothetical protein